MSDLEKLLDGADVTWLPLEKILAPKGYIRGPFGSALKKAFFVVEGVPVYEQQHAIYDKRDFRYFVDSQRAESLKRFAVQPNDIIISCSGTIGKISIIKEDDQIGIINQALLIMRFDLSKINIKYVKHYLECFPRLIVSSSGGAITNIEKRMVIEKIEIPIPCPDDPKKSLEIQAEIVRILDAFTSLTAEITAEITARKKQYNYYRDQLLSFDEDEVEYKPLGDEVTLRRGRVMSKDYLFENQGDYPVYSSQTENNGMIGKINTFDFDGVFISWTTDGANAGTVFYRTGKFSITNVCGLMKINDETRLNYKFLFYWLSIEAQRHVYSGMGNPKLMSHQVEKIPIPIPCPNDPEKSLKIQGEIVRILDAFTSLTAELTAELTARKKQYEYYRNLLLNFPKPVEATA